MFHQTKLIREMWHTTTTKIQHTLIILENWNFAKFWILMFKKNFFLNVVFAKVLFVNCMETFPKCLIFEMSFWPNVMFESVTFPECFNSKMLHLPNVLFAKELFAKCYISKMSIGQMSLWPNVTSLQNISVIFLTEKCRLNANLTSWTGLNLELGAKVLSWIVFLFKTIYFSFIIRPWTRSFAHSLLSKCFQ